LQIDINYIILMLIGTASKIYDTWLIKMTELKIKI